MASNRFNRFYARRHQTLNFYCSDDLMQGSSNGFNLGAVLRTRADNWVLSARFCASGNWLQSFFSHFLLRSYVCIINPSHPCYWTTNTTFTCFKCKIKPPVKRVTKSSRNVSDLDNIHKVTKTNFPRHHCFSSSLNLKAISCSSRNYIFCNIHPLWICFIFHIYW